MSTPVTRGRINTAVRNRNQLERFENFSAGGNIVAADAGTLNLAPALAGHQYHVRRVTAFVFTDAAQTATFQPTTTTTNPFALIKTSPGVGFLLSIDYGEVGWPAPEGEGLDLALSAAGLAFSFEVEFYRTLRKQSSGVLTPAQAIP